MKKKLMRWLLALAVIIPCLVFSASAASGGVVDSGYCGGEGNGKNLTWTLYGDGELVISGTGAMENWDWETDAPWALHAQDIKKVTIGKSVTAIGSHAFQYCHDMTSVSISAGVTVIGECAFFDCDGLTSVTIPAKVVSIDYDAFFSCSRLTAITVDSANTAYSSENGVLFNKDKTKLILYPIAKGETYTIPSSVTAIEKAAFNESWLTAIYVNSGNKAFCSVDGVLFDKNKTVLVKYPGGKSGAYTIPNGVTAIGNSAFALSEVTAVTIPDSVTEIGEYAFDGCWKMTSVNIGKGVKTIEFGAFEGCEILTTVTIPDSVTEIGGYAFADCWKMTSVNIGKGVKTIEVGTFTGCESLTTVTIPDSVTEIYFDAFSYCNNLTTVTVGNQVSVIGGWAFADCPKLKTFKTFSPDTYYDYDCFDGSPNVTIHGPAGSTAQTYAIKNGIPFVALSTQSLGKPVVTVSNNAATGKIVLTWNKVAGAEKYEVYRATSKNGTYTKLTTTTGTKLTNTSAVAGTTYYYKVRAVAGANKGEFSDIKSRACDLVQPVVTLTLNSKGNPVLTWNKVEGASKYDVYRATSKNGTYTKLTTTTGTKLTNTSATLGTVYYYKVVAVCGTNSAANSAYSEVKYTRALAAPVVTVSNNATTGKIVLTWNKVAGAEKYEVYRATSSNGTYTKLTTTTGTKLTNTSAEAGKTYYYKVRAITGTVSKSQFSAVKYRTCDLAQPVVTIALNASGKPVLTWNKVSGASKYDIYRATSLNGTYTKLSSVTGTKLTNTSAKAGTTYYYKVVAVCGSTSAGNSAYSAVKSIKSK